MAVRASLVVAVVSALASACVSSAATGPVPVEDPRGARDPINLLAAPALAAHAQSILGELVRALPAERRARVANATLVRDGALGEINAYATCRADGAPLIAVSDGLLAVAAHLAQATAIDERWQTETRRSYYAHLATHGAAPPPAGLYPAAYRADGEKLLRQRELFDEQVAFILGHELAHHYLGHLGCDGQLDAIVRATTGVALFDQGTELAADVAAVKNVMTAGVRRPGHAWTEAGALLVLAAFHHRAPLTPERVLFAFERTHPLPALRLPLVTTTADLWRVSGALPL